MKSIVSNIQASQAYHKAIKQNQGIVPSQELKNAEQQMNVLRLGDDMIVNKVQKPQSFPDILKDVISKEIGKVSAGEKKVKSSLRGALDDSQPYDQLQIMSALNESEVALQLIVGGRDKLVNAFNDILKMPL